MATNPRLVGELTQTIAAELRAQRVARRLKQEEVSAATGIPVNTLSKIERGLTAIDVEQIEKIAIFYGMLPEELWSLARRNASIRQGKESVYLPDGRLNPSKTRGFTPSPEDIAELPDGPHGEGDVK